MPDGWAIFAAGNRQGDRGVTYSMPSPLANRFSHFEVETHLDDWVSWAYRNGIDERVIAFLRFRPELLFDFDPGPEGRPGQIIILKAAEFSFLCESWRELLERAPLEIRCING